MEIVWVVLVILAAVVAYIAGSYGAYHNTTKSFLAALKEVEIESLSRERTTGPDAAAQFSDAAIIISDVFSNELERNSYLFRSIAGKVRKENRI